MAATDAVVIFHYVLHHTRDGNTISLLQEAFRVTRQFVLVAEPDFDGAALAAVAFDGICE